MMQQQHTPTENAVISTPKSVSDHEENATLPNAHSNPVGSAVGSGYTDRSVMCAGLFPLGERARSEGTEEPVVGEGRDAGAVTGQATAQLATVPGAVPAHTGPTLLAGPAMSNATAAKQYVIEATTGDANANVIESSPPAKTTQMYKAVMAVMHDAKSAGADNMHKAMLIVFDEATYISREEAFAIVTAARARLTKAQEDRRARKDTPASERTIRDYEKKCVQVDRERDEVDTGSPNTLFEVMCRHAQAKQTFQALKSALRWRSLEQMREQLSAQDVLQRSQPDSPRWKQTVWRVQCSMSELQRIDDLKRSECLLWADKHPKPSRSKRRILHRLPEDWQSRFLNVNQSSGTYRLAGVLLRYCGLRPSEFETGVRLRWTPRGVRVLIAGAKVRPTAGQPWRSFLLDPSALPTWFIDELRVKKRIVVQAQADAMRAHLGRMSQPVCNPDGQKRRERLVLSAYVFRHALVTDLREQGWDGEQIAALIGETSERTLTCYGTRVHAGSRKVKPVVAIVPDSVRAPRPVKPVDRSGLEPHLRKKAKASGAKRASQMR